jgi:hypothetical protein
VGEEVQAGKDPQRSALHLPFEQAYGSRLERSTSLPASA